jgi:hypothetical protein
MSNLSNLSQIVANTIKTYLQSQGNKSLNLVELKTARQRSNSSNNVSGLDQLIASFGNTLEANEVDSAMSTIEQMDGVAGLRVDSFSSDPNILTNQRKEFDTFDTFVRYNDGGSQSSINNTSIGQAIINDPTKIDITQAIKDSPQTFLTNASPNPSSPQTSSLGSGTSFGIPIASDQDIYSNGSQVANQYKDINIPINSLAVSGIKLSDMIFDNSKEKDPNYIANLIDDIKVTYKGAKYSFNANNLGISNSPNPHLIFDPGSIDFNPAEATITITPKGGTESTPFKLSGNPITAQSRLINITTQSQAASQTNSSQPNNPSQTTTTTQTQQVTALNDITDKQLERSILSGNNDNDRVSTASLLANYFNAQKAAFASLGVSTTTVTLDDTNKEPFTRGLNMIHQAALAQAGSKSNNTQVLSPEALLKTAYREQVLIGLRLILGNKFQEQTDKIANALTQKDAGTNINGTQYLKEFTDNKTQLTNDSSNYLSKLGIWKTLDTAGRTSLYEQANNITSGNSTNAATGWLSLYGNKGLGGRTFAVIKDGDITETGNASVNKNMPAFATRWLFKDVDELNSLDTAKTLLKDKLGIELDNQVFKPIKEQLEAKLNELIKSGGLNNLVAGLLATSIKSLSPQANSREVKVTLDTNNLLSRFFENIMTGIDPNVLTDALKKQIAAIVVGNNATKEINMTLANNISWDNPSTNTNATSSPAYIVLNELFNTKNNPNNSDKARPDATIINGLISSSTTQSDPSNSTQPTSEALKTNTQIAALTPANYTIPAAANALTTDTATELIANWLKAKETIYSTDTNIAQKARLELAKKFTTDKYYDFIEEIVNDSIQYTFTSHIINKVEDFTVNGDTATAKFTITEATQSNNATPKTYDFTFKKTADGWKISDRP